MSFHFLKQTYYDNSVQHYLIAVGTAVATLVGLKVVKTIVLSRLERLADRTKTSVDDIVVQTLQRTRWFFYVAAAVYAGATVLHLHKALAQGVHTFLVIAAFLQVGLWFQIASRLGVQLWMDQKNLPATRTMAAAVGFIVRLATWSMILLLVLSNLGVEIGALVAGLGIGGIAAALAVQNMLGDLFASLSLYFDRPFDIGDFIIVDDEMGTVDRIGVRSTQIRSLGGEQIIFANGDLAKSRVRNYKRMSERRILFQIGVIYGTPAEKLEKIPSMVRTIISNDSGLRFDRCHFQSYGDFSLNFEIVYYVLSPDYNVYMDKQHAINLAMYREFEKVGIEFAFPTRTLFLHQVPQTEGKSAEQV